MNTPELEPLKHWGRVEEQMTPEVLSRTSHPRHQGCIHHGALCGPPGTEFTAILFYSPSRGETAQEMLV